MIIGKSGEGFCQCHTLYLLKMHILYAEFELNAPASQQIKNYPIAFSPNSLTLPAMLPRAVLVPTSGSSSIP